MDMETQRNRPPHFLLATEGGEIYTFTPERPRLAERTAGKNGLDERRSRKDMNKLLHALIYILLAVTGTMLYFEIQLDKKRQLLGDRNLALENALVELASTIETNSPPRTKLESDQKCRIDISPIEANPEVSIVYSDILDDSYRAHLELNASGPFSWNDAATRLDLRKIYQLDREGKPVPSKVNPGKFEQEGTPMAMLLAELQKRAAAQLDTLKETRKELKATREKIPPIVKKFNDLAKEARADKKTIVDRDATIKELETDKQKLSDDVKNRDRTIADQNTEISSLKQEVQTARDETALKQEELEKAQKKADELDRSLRQCREDLRKAQEALRNSGGVVARGGGTGGATAIMSDGKDKGKIVFCDNDKNFCVVEFHDDALKEMMGDDLSAPLPIGEMIVRRPGADGSLGVVVGRISLKNFTRGTKLVTADILREAKQTDFQPGDIVFPE